MAEEIVCGSNRQEALLILSRLEEGKFFDHFS
jgi:hypothetical protein